VVRCISLGKVFLVGIETVLTGKQPPFALRGQYGERRTITRLMAFELSIKLRGLLGVPVGDICSSNQCTQSLELCLSS
jgi:hypothetical protein